MHNIVVVGANGGIGSQFVEELANRYPDANIHALARGGQPYRHAENVHDYAIDYFDESLLAQYAGQLSATMPIDAVFVTTGILHDAVVSPEKSLKALSQEKLQHVFAVNTVIPALIAKHFVPKLSRHTRSVFAALSARVGSVSDNHLGGWYGYRMSKAALNMLIKNTAIETRRTHPLAIIIGLHPGTVDTALSQPFQKHVPENKLFTTTQAVSYLLAVVEQLTPAESGQLFDWNGKQIQP